MQPTATWVRLGLITVDPEPQLRLAAQSMLSRSLSGLGVRSAASGRVRTNAHDFEAHSGPTQRKIRGIWAALPPAVGGEFLIIS